MESSLKSFFGALAIFLTFAGYYPYVRSLHRGEARPHALSWVTWAVATLVVFLAQLKADGGMGAWPIGLSGLLTAYVAGWACVKRSGGRATALDWGFFWVAMASIPGWYLTEDPFWAVALLTLVDVLGFGPTARKTYADPWGEPVSFYAIFAARNAASVPALEAFSWTTLLFPVVTGAACAAMAGWILWRRRKTGVGTTEKA